GRIDEVFVAAAKVKLPDAKGFAAWQREMIAKLREGPFRHLGEIKVAGVPLQSFGTGDSFIVFLTTEEGVTVTVDHPMLSKSAKTTSLIVQEEDPGSQEKMEQWPRGVEIGNTWSLRPRGEKGAWSRKNPPNTVERSYALIGKTV